MRRDRCPLRRDDHWVGHYKWHPFSPKSIDFQCGPAVNPEVGANLLTTPSSQEKSLPAVGNAELLGISNDNAPSWRGFKIVELLNRKTDLVHSSRGRCWLWTFKWWPIVLAKASLNESTPKTPPSPRLISVPLHNSFAQLEKVHQEIPEGNSTPIAGEQTKKWGPPVGRPKVSVPKRMMW